jgi:hypothetical protein
VTEETVERAKINVVVVLDDREPKQYDNVSFWRVERDGSLTILREVNGKNKPLHSFAAGYWLEVYEEK